MNDTGFVFVLSNLTIADDTLPFELDEKATLRRPSEFELTIYRKLLEHAGIYAKTIVEHGSVVERDPEALGLGIYAPPKTPQLLIVETKQYNQHVQTLNLAGKLASFNFVLGGHSLYADDKKRDKSSITTFLNYYEIQLLDEFTRAAPIKVSLNELQELRLYYVLLKKEADIARISRALAIYRDIDVLPRFSELRTLSYFAVLECLLTKKESAGAALSIEKQLQRKTELLCNFIGYSHEATSYFGLKDQKKLWTKLYTLRSNIAHGNVYEFSGDLSSLVSMEHVNSFMDKLVREMLRTAINHQQLVSDLSAC